MMQKDYIQELEDTLIEAIEKKDPKVARRFVLTLIERQERNSDNIMHSIELLTQEMISLRREMDKRFESLQREMDKRFESLQREMNARFESMDKRFEALDKRIGILIWFVGISFVLLSLFMGLARFFPV